MIFVMLPLHPVWCLSLMPKQPPDYPVLVPYSQLCELLEASQRVKDYEKQVAQLNDQVLALRIIQQQCLEQLRELKKLI